MTGHTERDRGVDGQAGPGGISCFEGQRGQLFVFLSNDRLCFSVDHLVALSLKLCRKSLAQFDTTVKSALLMGAESEAVHGCLGRQLEVANHIFVFLRMDSYRPIIKGWRKLQWTHILALGYLVSEGGAATVLSDRKEVWWEQVLGH